MSEQNLRFIRTLTTGALTLALLAPAGGQAAGAPGDLAARFGALKAVQQASLSPDGARLISVQTVGGRGTSVLVADLTGSGPIQPKAIFAVSGDPDRLDWCRWAGTQRIVCLDYATTSTATATRLIEMDPDGANRRTIPVPSGGGEIRFANLSGGTVIDWSPGAPGHIVLERLYVPEKTTGSLLALTDEGLGVDDLDLSTLRTRWVEPADPDAFNYIADATGAVRIIARRTAKGRFDTGEARFSYRPVGGHEWRPLSTAKGREGFRPYGFDTQSGSVIGLEKLNGRMAVYRKALDGTGTETLLFARPDVDVDSFLRIGPRGRIVGVSYVTERREAVYFDPALRTLAGALARGMPERPLIRFLDESQDGRRLLIWAGSDVDPGRYYLFDRAARHMDELMLERPPLAGQKLAAVKAVSYPAADGTMVPAYLTLPPNGRSSGKALVMPHGGPGERDQWGFDWMAQFYAAQGYAVLQPNYRGSSGYGDAWMAGNGFKGWRVAIGDVTDAGRWLITQGIAQPGRLGILGWSYGGYAALQAAETAPDLFKAVVAVAPITDLEQLKNEYSNASNYAVLSDFIGSGPELDQASPARHVERMAAPVLLFHGTYDQTIDIDASRLMDRKLKGAGKSSTLVAYPGLDHALNDGDARADLLRRSLQFLDGNLGR